MLCAFAISAVAAQGALANQAYTCVPGVGNLDFKDAHCKTKVPKPTGNFGHVLVTKKTTITGSNETEGGATEPTKLASVQSGVELELESTELTGTGTMENKATWAEGTGVITYKKVVVTKPAGKGCKVKGGEVVTNSLKATTEGLTEQLKFTPATGTVFAEFTVEGCSIAALNHVYKAEGSTIGKTEGATTRFTKAETKKQATLKLSGQVAELEGVLTIKGANGNGLATT
jgi:hypothetical protein